MESFKPQILLNFANPKAFSNLQITIETERLYIRSYKDEDFEYCVGLYGDEKLTTFFDHGKPRSRSEVEDLVAERGHKYFDKGLPFGLFSIFDKNDMSFAGQLDIVPTEENDTAEIGCILLQKYHNQGIALESLKAIITDYVDVLNKADFNTQFLPIKKIIATVHPKNYASEKMLRNLGMSFDKSQERFGHPRLWYSLNVIENTNPSTQHIWHAENYHQNSSVQQEAATEVLKHLEFAGNEQVIDIGCGDGKITANIANKVKKGAVIGIDSSKEMIDFAQRKFPKNNFNNLDFQIHNAEHLNYQNQFDIVFSSFAIQWLRNKDSFFQRAYNSLKPAGHLCLTIPLGISTPLNHALNAVMSNDKWATYFRQIDRLVFTTDNEYLQLIGNHKFALKHAKVLQHEVIFASQKEFENYVFPWLPYQNCLPKNQREAFFREIVSLYLQFEPLFNNGKVRFQFPRIDVIAVKPPL